MCNNLSRIIIVKMIIVNDDLIVIFVEFLLLFKNVFDFEKKFKLKI